MYLKTFFQSRDNIGINVVLKLPGILIGIETGMSDDDMIEKSDIHHIARTLKTFGQVVVLTARECRSRRMVMYKDNSF